MTKDFESLKKEVYTYLEKKKFQNIKEDEIAILRLKFNIALDWHNLGYDKLAIRELEELKFSIATLQPKKKRPIKFGPINISFRKS